MSVWSSAKTRERITHILRLALDSPVFRRRLHFDSKRALTEVGLAGPSPPEHGLVARRELVDVFFDDSALYMPALSRPADRLPLAVRLLVYGVKPLVLIHGIAEQLAGVLRWAECHGLHGIFAPYEFDVSDEPGKGAFHDLARCPRASRGDDPSAMRALLLARDDSTLILGYLATLWDWDDYLGMLLGYPECCVKAFVERWPLARRHHTGDVAALLAECEGIGPHPWPLNVFGRYFGFEIIAHFPCRFDCGASLRNSYSVLRALKLAEPNTLAAIEHALRGVVVYTPTTGVCLLPAAKQVERARRKTWQFDPTRIHATVPDGSLASALRREARVGWTADEVVVGDLHVAGHVIDLSAAASGSSHSQPSLAVPAPQPAVH